MGDQKFFKKNYSNFYRTPDNKEIHYSTNFDPRSEELHKNVLIWNYGLVCSNVHWENQLPFFDSLGYKIMIHDYRGHFKSTGENDLETIDFKNFATDIRGIIQEAAIVDPIMIGHSMGANVILEFAKLFPNVATKLVIVCGTIMPVTEVMFNSNIMDLITPYINGIFKKFPSLALKLWKTSGFNPVLKRIVKNNGFNPDKVSDQFIEKYLINAGQIRYEIFFKLFNELRTHNMASVLHNIALPILIIAGEKDKVIPVYVQQILHSNLPNSELFTIKDGSHVPQVDFPDKVNEIILKFISK